jgi:RNase P/RNase MRP subunit p29
MNRSVASYVPNEGTRPHNLFSRNINTLQNPFPTQSTLTDIAAQESGRIDPEKIQRRITLRPIMSNYPFPPSYINSFYKYKSIDYTQTSTEKPSFKKTTRESLWSPSVSAKLSATTTPISPTEISGSKSLVAKLLGTRTKIVPASSKGTTYITGKVLRPSNSSVATTVETSVRTAQFVPENYTHLEIVTSKSTHIDGQEVTEVEIGDAEKEEEATTHFLSRYGTGSGASDQSNEYISTLPSVVFDDDQNNVGAEQEVVEEETESPSSSSKEMFFQGNGIRRPDTQSVTTWKSKASSEDEQTTMRINNSNEKDREASQVHSPATMKMYQFQRNKTPVSWAKKSGRSIASSASIGPSKIGLGPRLKFRIKNQ